MPITLDVSVRPQINGSINDKEAYGRVYKSAICSWIDEINKDQMFSEQKILIFTLPSIFKDYDLMSASCNLKRIPIWLSYRPLDGDKPENEPNIEIRKMISNLYVGLKAQKIVVSFINTLHRGEGLRYFKRMKHLI